MKTSIAVVLAATSCSTMLSGCGTFRPQPREVEIKNEALYQDGAFQADRAKDAYFAMMRRFDYPIPAVLESDNFWVCDFLQAEFAKLGMGGIFWVNESGTYGQTGARRYEGSSAGQPFGYLGHEIFVLPGQALPEHRHVGGSEGFGPKMEAWHVRYGEAHFFSEFATPGGDEILISELPEAERPWGYGQPWFRCRYVATRKAGEMYKLNDPESWHFLRAGANGAIITEYATYHNHVEFSKPGMAFASTGYTQ